MMKGYKVTDRNRTKMVGVGCDSLGQLVAKAVDKLGLRGPVVAALDDGTIVDDEEYFQALPSQTVFVLYQSNENIVTGVDFILNVLRRVNTAFLETGSKAREFVRDKTNELMTILKEEGVEGQKKIHQNTPEEDPDWFADLETTAKTKDEVMFRRSQDRIRGYLYKFQDDIRKCSLFMDDVHFRKMSQDCLRFFKKQLKSDEYFGCYFDRRCSARYPDVVDSAQKNKRKATTREPPRKKLKLKNKPGYDRSSYCNESGTFVCQGRWKSENCEYTSQHQINPYLSREARILFSTWNLDHRIERSRSVAPSFVKAIQACGKSRSVNFLYFYQLLFTKLNLKLVHVVCHDKSVHDVSCDPRFLYTEKNEYSP